MENLCESCSHKKVCMFEPKYRSMIEAVKNSFEICDDPIGSASPFSIKLIECKYYKKSEIVPRNNDYAIGTSPLLNSKRTAE